MSSSLELQNLLFELVTSRSRFFYKTPWFFFNDFEIHQNSFLLKTNHLEKSIFFCRTSAARSWNRENLSYVCGGFNENIASSFTFIYQPRSALMFRAAPHVFALQNKVLVAPAPLTILTKHIVRLRWRCSCEMCRTSKVPLLVFAWNTFKTKLKKHWNS